MGNRAYIHVDRAQFRENCSTATSLPTSFLDPSCLAICGILTSSDGPMGNTRIGALERDIKDQQRANQYAGVASCVE